MCLILPYRFRLNKDPNAFGTLTADVTLGHGIGDTGCCGLTMSVNIQTGQPYIEIEDWRPGVKSHSIPICDNSGTRGNVPDCSQYGSSNFNLGPLYGKDVAFNYVVQHMNGDVYYTGYANGMKIGTLVDPKYPAAIKGI